MIDQVVVVTGGSRGIGRAIAVQAGAQGAQVVVNYQTNEAAAQSVVEQIVGAGGRAIAMKANIANSDEVNQMFQAVKEQFVRVDVLVNNAGITRDKLVMRLTDEDWDSVINTNLGGAFRCCRAVAPMMLKQKGGVIVNIGSVIGTAGGAGQANYSAAKAGLVGLTKSLARELGSRNIRVNAVCPGFIDTDMTQVLKPEQREAAIQQVPLGRLGQPDDIASVVSFLCSPGAAYIHGTVITVDGGLFI
jgi:3-oxoacyl-[acyl-carrier protein] reductase